MDDPSHRSQAQDELDRLVQGRTRLFALGLGGLNALVGLLNLLLMPLLGLQVLGPLAALTLAGMLALAHWLRLPRASFLVDFAGGTAALLAVASALVHLAFGKDLENTTHLILIAAGAGFFLFSLPWFLATSLFIVLGWTGVILAEGIYPFPLHYGLELVTAVLLGLLIHLVRRDLLKRFLDLLVQNHQREAEQVRLMGELQEALDKVKTLRGLIPICAVCKKIRDDQGYWQQVEVFVHDHSEAVFSHSLCPACLARTKAEFDAYLEDG